MQRASSVGWGFLATVTMAALIGCAVGTADENVDDTSSLTSIPVEAGGDENSVKLPPPTSNVDASDDEDASSGDGGTVVTDGGTGTPDSGPPVDLCKAPNVCSGATDLGSISGDEGGDVKTATGAGSQWFKILVNETDNGVGGNSEKARFALTSPAGENFDLYLYRSGNTNALECSSVTQSSTSTAATESTDMTWGESGLFSNGSDDSALVTIEVRHVSGTCAATAKWTLTVTGNP